MKTNTENHPNLFEEILSVNTEEIEFTLRGIKETPWSQFLLNPRRLRGSDFLMRWSQGLWSERRFTDALNTTGKYFCIPYGPSSTAPSGDVRAFELYFERLEAAGLNDTKRPDLLIFQKKHQKQIKELIKKLGGVEELPFISEEDNSIEEILQYAIIAVECENSLWVAKKMPSYGEKLRPMRRLGGLPGLPKKAVLPTVIIKEEDLERLLYWQNTREVPIHIWHGFYDLAFGLSLSRANEIIEEGLIERTIQRFQAPGGSTSEKAIYKFYYHYTYQLGEATSKPDLVADHIIDKNGHILPYVRFEGGKIELKPDAVQTLANITQSKEP